MAKGLNQQFVATATLSDNSTVDVTSVAEWTSEDVDLATVTGTGLAVTKAEGTVIIRARYSDYSDTATLKVLPAVVRELQITSKANTLSVPKGLTNELVATEVYTDGAKKVVTDTAAWQSSDASVATVDKGLVKGLNTGSVQISATSSGKTATASITVVNATLSRIEVDARAGTEAKIAKGFYQRFVATGIFSDNSTQDISSQVVWTSATPAVATISNAADSKGLARGVAAGSSAISAALAGVDSKTSGHNAVLTVTNDTLAAISVEPPSKAIALGESQRYTATGTFSGTTPPNDITAQVTWDSSDDSVATISNASSNRGQAMSQSVGGPVAISATLNGVSSGSSSGSLTVTAATLKSIQISPADVVLPQGFNRIFSAIGTFSDGSSRDVTTDVTWSSLDSNVATVSNVDGSEGVAHGGAAGTTTISAGRDGVSQSTQLTVTDAALAELAVTPESVSAPLGATQAFKATGHFDDGFSMDLTDEVSWQSTDANIATVGNAAPNAGVASARAQGGPVSITAARGGVSNSASLTVTSASITGLTVRRAGSSCTSPTEPADTDLVLPIGFKGNLIACATYTDGNTRDVTGQATWTSQATSVATVGNDAGSKGLVTAVAEGRTVAVASLEGQSDTAPIQVTTATLASIDVTPKGQTLNGSGSIQFNAIGTFSDSSTLSITSQVTWSSSSDTVTISNAKGSEGQAKPSGTVLTSTTVTITATRGTVKGTTTVNRTP